MEAHWTPPQPSPIRLLCVRLVMCEVRVLGHCANLCVRQFVAMPHFVVVVLATDAFELDGFLLLLLVGWMDGGFECGNGLVHLFVGAHVEHAHPKKDHAPHLDLV